MGTLTESDIFACLVENFRIAAECCDDLARLPAKGPTYRRLIPTLKLLEGACRQAGHYRENYNWFDIGICMAQAHQRAGGFLRTQYPHSARSELFKKLGANLRGFALAADRLRHARSGVRGSILPVTPNFTPTLHQVRSPGGIILPGAV